jgi:hypothetical protein
MSRGAMGDMLTMNSLGDGSTLSLDFTTGVLDSRLTFTRSTTATYINSSGYVTVMGAAATNDPTKARFDYSPTNIGEPRGLLIEGAATNLTKFNETFTNAYWNTTANNVTAADSVATSPTGVALTASTLTEIAGTVTRHIHQLTGEFTPTGSTAYTMSCFVKQPTSNAIQYVQLTFWSAGFGLTAYMNYDLQAGTIGTGGAGITASSITAYPNGWYRITATATSVAVPGASGFQLGFSTTSGAVRTESYTASAPLKSIQLFGAQVEVGSGATSYISTGASQVTRNTDYCTIPTASFISGNPYPQTLFVDCIPNTPSGAFLDIARVFDRTGGGTFAYGTEIYYYTAATMNVQRKVAAATNTDRSLASGLAYGTRHKLALSINASSFSGSYNGVTGLGVSTAPAALATVATHLGIGCTGDSSPASVMFGTIRQIKFYPTALTQAQINALTAL